MVFKMSYGAPPPPPAKAATAKPAPKKAASPRTRKGGTLQEKAQALFEPAPGSAPASDQTPE